MSTYVQAERPLTVTTPLGPDTLFLVGFSGSEGLSRLFLYELQAIAKNEQKVPFDQLLGKKVTTHVMAPSGDKRHFSGICCRVAQGGRDPYFTTYRLEVVPEFWFLTRRAQSRIFQAKSVPDILKKVLEGLKVQYQLQGTYQPRDYCVQYRETDFNFASRLMEEEGMFYFFRHTENESTMVVADNPGAHPDVPFGSTAIFAPLVDTNVDEERIFTWEKIQELRAMKVTLWDHCFEKPHEHLEAQKDIQSSVGVGSVEHKLSLGAAAKLELYDWPGEYAQRFDGVGPGREDRPSDIQKIFQDNQRTAQIRMEQEAMPSLLISGESKLRQMTPGHKFTLERHHNADGSYVVTEVMHQANQSAVYRSGDTEEFFYNNTFSCIPAALPYRPRRVASKPVVPGTQTAVVVGPKGEELYTDKYGRVKVQFHWDRDGKNDQNSSCWIRVAQPIAGRRWGTSFWPRIGQEVVVDFLEGDPDQPIIVGCVYNADQMPPYLGDGPDSKHKDDNKVSGFKSNITKGGDGFNEWRFDDTKDKEQIFIHAQKNMDVRVKNDSMEHVLNDRHLIVGKDGKGNQYELVEKDKHLHVKENHVEKIDKAMILTVGSGYDLIVKGDAKVKIQGTQSNTYGQDLQEKVGMNWANETGMEIHLKAGMKMILEAGMQLTLKGPGGFIDIGPTGVTIQGLLVNINSGGAAGVGSGASPAAPKEAKPKDPNEADDAVTGQKSC
jgi:type VI secretion system secreted protein VgrG